MTSEKIITPDFGNRSNEIFRVGISVQLLYADDYVWLVRQTITASAGEKTIKHQLVELPPKE